MAYDLNTIFYVEHVLYICNYIETPEARGTQCGAQTAGAYGRFYDYTRGRVTFVSLITRRSG
jgi:hypothetical protein